MLLECIRTVDLIEPKKYFLTYVYTSTGEKVRPINRFRRKLKNKWVFNGYKESRYRCYISFYDLNETLFALTIAEDRCKIPFRDYSCVIKVRENDYEIVEKIPEIIYKKFVKEIPKSVWLGNLAIPDDPIPVIENSQYFEVKLERNRLKNCLEINPSSQFSIDKYKVNILEKNFVPKSERGKLLIKEARKIFEMKII